jgi:hypothetical protein
MQVECPVKFSIEIIEIAALPHFSDFTASALKRIARNGVIASQSAFRAIDLHSMGVLVSGGVSASLKCRMRESEQS